MADYGRVLMFWILVNRSGQVQARNWITGKQLAERTNSENENVKYVSLLEAYLSTSFERNKSFKDTKILLL